MRPNRSYFRRRSSRRWGGLKGLPPPPVYGGGWSPPYGGSPPTPASLPLPPASVGSGGLREYVCTSNITVKNKCSRAGACVSTYALGGERETTNAIDWLLPNSLFLFHLQWKQGTNLDIQPLNLDRQTQISWKNPEADHQNAHVIARLILRFSHWLIATHINRQIQSHPQTTSLIISYPTSTLPFH